MYRYLFLAGSSLLAAQPALAAEDSAEPIIVVTATGLPRAIEDTGQPVSVIDRAEIDAVQGADVTRMLQRLPGVTFSRNGGFGALTTVGVRGAAADQLLVLIDGARVGDVASTGGEFDFSQLAAGTIDRLELLRGPNSVVWGSSAIGGVMAITTRIEDGAAASLEYGGDDQVTATAALGHAGERLEAGISGSYVDNEGFSAASAGTEDDGFTQYNVNARARYALTDVLSLTADARYSEGKLEQDGSDFAPPYGPVDSDGRQEMRGWSGRTGLAYTGDALSLTAAFSIADTERDLIDPYFPFSSDGRSERVELLGRWTVAGPFAVDFGADHEWISFSAVDPFNTDRGKDEISSAHSLFGFYGETLSLAAGLRYDDHSGYGDAWTFGANGAWSFSPGWRLRAAYGEGFKAPSLYQRLSQYGNPGLEPEESRTYDIGIDFGSREEPLFVSLSAFRRDARKLIDFFSCFGSAEPLCATRPFGFYFNEDKARAQGTELEVRAALAPGLRAGFAWAWIDTEIRTPGDFYEGNEFGRRPNHTVTLSLDWETNFGLSLGADVRYAGEAWDNRANAARLDSFAVGDIRASYALNDTLELFGRVENVWDEDYEIASGYNTQGRTAYFGVRLKR